MNRADAKKLRGLLNDVLSDEGIERLDLDGQLDGYKITIGRCTFGATSASFKVEIAEVDESGMAITQQAQDFIDLADSYGLKAGDLGVAFRHGGEVFKIVGLSVRSRKYPILMERNGRAYKYPARTAALMIENAEEIVS